MCPKCCCNRCKCLLKSLKYFTNSLDSHNIPYCEEHWAFQFTNKDTETEWGRVTCPKFPTSWGSSEATPDGLIGPQSLHLATLWCCCLEFLLACYPWCPCLSHLSDQIPLNRHRLSARQGPAHVLLQSPLVPLPINCIQEGWIKARIILWLLRSGSSFLDGEKGHPLRSSMTILPRLLIINDSLWSPQCPSLIIVNLCNCSLFFDLQI